MKNEELSLEILNSVKAFLSQLPTVSYGTNAIQYLNLDDYGSGQAGFDSLKSAFDALDLSKTLKFTELDKEIKKQKKILKDLESKHTNLVEIIGDITNGSEGSLASTLVLNLKQEIDHLIVTRDKLITDIASKEVFYNSRDESAKLKFEEDNTQIETKITNAKETAELEIKNAEINAKGKVKLINQFRDFLEETNKNMNLYSIVIIGILIAAIAAISFSIPNLLTIFDSYDAFIKGYGNKIQNWHIINYALGLLIVKLPWALCLSAVLTGMYSLLKGLLVTYEKINQDKRNMSAIYAISGNVAQALNEYGVLLAEIDSTDEETGTEKLKINVSTNDLARKKEDIRWNQIMKYFEGMQQNKIEVPDQEDPSKLKLVSGLLNKMIDKLPKT